MSSPETEASLDELETCCRSIYDIAKMGRKHKKSLTGNNSYGNRFHEADLALTKAEAKIKIILASVGLDGEVLGSLSDHIGTMRSVMATDKQRNESLKQVRMICQATILPAIESMTASPVPQTEQVLPLDVVRGTRSYIEKVVTQANGCYEHQWFDACSVMVRRLVETLIIEVYEHRGMKAEIEDGKGGYIMLNGLINKILTEKSWKLSRETISNLPEIKSLSGNSEFL